MPHQKPLSSLPAIQELQDVSRNRTNGSEGLCLDPANPNLLISYILAPDVLISGLEFEIKLSSSLTNTLGELSVQDVVLDNRPGL